MSLYVESSGFVCYRASYEPWHKYLAMLLFSNMKWEKKMWVSWIQRFDFYDDLAFVLTHNNFFLTFQNDIAKY